jgi:hypothetical protein
MTFLQRLRDGWLNFHRRPLPLRFWLIFAGAAVIGAGFVAQMGLTAAFVIWDQQAESTRLASVRQIIGTDATRWQDPSWQRQADASLDALNTEIAVFGGQSGTMVYATAGARSLLSVDAAGTPATPTSAVGQHADGDGVSGQTLPEFQRIVISELTGATAGHATTDVAFLWFTAPPPGEPSSALWPGVELGTFAITLALVVWLVGWPVLRPLAEMSRAAESIAGGDLTIHLPQSPVRESRRSPPHCRAPAPPSASRCRGRPRWRRSAGSSWGLLHTTCAHRSSCCAAISKDLSAASRRPQRRWRTTLR